MRPAPWQPPVPLSPPEEAIVKRVGRAKLSGEQQEDAP